MYVYSQSPLDQNQSVVVHAVDEKVHAAIVAGVPVVPQLAEEHSGQAEQHRNGEDERDEGNNQVTATIPHPDIVVVVAVLLVEVLTGQLSDGLLHVQVVVEDGHVVRGVGGEVGS